MRVTPQSFAAEAFTANDEMPPADARLNYCCPPSMGSAVPSPPRIRFGVFDFDPRSGELWKQGRKIHLEGQPVQILTCLLEKPGEVVTREELHRRLWAADTFVNFEHGLNAAMKRLRQALNDSAESPRFVETLPRRGYRFVAPVQPFPSTDAAIEHLGAPETPIEDPLDDSPGTDDTAVNVPQLSLNATRKRWVWALPLGIIVLSLALWLVQRLHLFRPPPAAIRSLAVLPLANLSGDASQEYFSDGMTDAIITELGQLSELQVISRTSTIAYKGTRKSLPEIARELKVDAVVEGAVFRAGNQVRITAQLIRAADDKHLWAKSYEGSMGDILALQRRVARSVAQEIRLDLTPREQAILMRDGKQVNPAAYEAYLKGRFFWNKRTAESLKKAVEYFNLALQKDPECTQAFAGLADAYSLLGDWEYAVMAPKDAYAKAKDAARKAIELDEALGEAHISLAFCLDNFDWDWARAGAEFNRGIQLSPGYATGHQWYAWHQAATGHIESALAEMRKAELLDPLSLIISADFAELLLVARRFDDAIMQARRTGELDPFFPLAHYELGQALIQKQQYAEGIAELQKAIELSSGDNSSYRLNLAYAYAVSGRKEEAREILTSLKNPSGQVFSNAPEIALAYAGLGDRDKSLTWLEEAYSQRFNPGVMLRPGFDSLRSDPRFESLLLRVGLR
jgi:TolB-like protein/DNA-binding winged helix-turn-helix (wHTH) protein/Flp pilus assembly protein TadD